MYLLIYKNINVRIMRRHFSDRVNVTARYSPLHFQTATNEPSFQLISSRPSGDFLKIKQILL